MYISNGLDKKVFYPKTTIMERYKHSIAMLYHPGEYKGCKYGLEVITRLRNKYPDLKCTIFGVPKRPKDIPNWIEYKRNASQEEVNRIYNMTRVVILPSVEEGFGLVGIESMACGCALCVSDFNGSREYAKHQHNALVSAPKDVKTMVDNVVSVFEDDSLAQSLSLNGIKTSADFDWQQSIHKLDAFIQNIL